MNEKIINWIRQITLLESEIYDFSEEFCSDYSFAEDVNSSIRFSVIMQSYRGLKQACEDMHQLIELACNKYNIPKEEFYATGHPDLRGTSK